MYTIYWTILNRKAGMSVRESCSIPLFNQSNRLAVVVNRSEPFLFNALSVYFSFL